MKLLVSACHGKGLRGQLPLHQRKDTPKAINPEILVYHPMSPQPDEPPQIVKHHPPRAMQRTPNTAKKSATRPIIVP